MAYVKKTLAPGEEYLYRAKFNWTYDVQSWAWFALACAPALIWAYALVSPAHDASAFGRGFAILATVGFLSGLTIIITRYVHKWTTVIAVTSMRLILKTGMIARDGHDVNLDKVEEVLVSQSILGHLLGFGKITVRGTGIAVIEFPVLGRPMEIRRELETAIERARGMKRLAAERTEDGPQG